MDARIQEISEEYQVVLKPRIKRICEKGREDLKPEDFVILAEASHKLWIISEILKGRTAFLDEDDEPQNSAALSTKELIDLYGRKIMEAKNKLLINK